MRHWVSAGAFSGFAVLALGSGGGEPNPVSVTVDAPTSVTVGQSFPCEVVIDNGSPGPLIVDRVVVSAGAVRALGLHIPGAPPTPFGDDQQFGIASITVPAGGAQRIAMQGTPYLSGSQSHRVEACGPDGTCYRGRISTGVNGGAEHAITPTWTVPEQVVVGTPFTITLDAANESGGPDMVESVGFHRATGDWLKRTASEPAELGDGDNLGRITWRHDVALEPGESARITWTAEVTKVGANSGKLTVCMASEPFCVDQDVSVIATSVPAP